MLRGAILTAVACAVSLVACGCDTGSPPIPDPSGTIPGAEARAFAERLSDAGFRVVLSGVSHASARALNDPSGSFLRSGAAWYNVDDDSISVWEYSNADDAEDDLRRIAPDRLRSGEAFQLCGTGGTYFYRGRLIVRHSGDDPRILAFLRSALAPPEATTPAPRSLHHAPDDFALRFDGDLCTGERVDTFVGGFSREINRGQWVTTRVRLDPAQRQVLFDLVTAVDLFSYPEEFTPRSSHHLQPARKHVITVRLEGQQHTIRWTDHDSNAPEARRLRKFICEVYGLFRALPEVAKLPRQESFCL